MKYVVIFLSLLIGIQFSYAETNKETLALDAANKWIAIIDAGKYKDSFKEASSFFKSKITEAQWDTGVGQARKPLGKLISRKVKDKHLTTKLPGAPDGEYCVIIFESQFENKKEATEMITPMIDKDGQWRVSGYFVK